jgi:2-acylglycerol O-acyltransferase 2
VDRALQDGQRLGIVPGGIAEMFEGYPKAGSKPNEEYSIVRKGFLRLCVQRGVPVIPVYVFGATKMFHRLPIPALERLSRWIRISVVVFFGIWGMPIPFRQRLSYVVGDPIVPTSSIGSTEDQVDDMYRRFCDELIRLFERHKEAYGWGHKTLKFITR